MTIRLSKEFLLYLFFFFMMTIFGIIYMAQSRALYEQPLNHNYTAPQANINTNTHSATMNGEVLGIVK